MNENFEVVKSVGENDVDLTSGRVIFCVDCICEPPVFGCNSVIGCKCEEQPPFLQLC